jgi:hypothetical protein
VVKGFKGAMERYCKGQAYGEQSGKEGTYIVLHVDARVNDIRARALAGAVVVHVRRGARLAVRDAAKAPGHVVLVDKVVGRHDAILLNVLDLNRVSITCSQAASQWLGRTSGSLLTSSNTFGLSRAAKPLNRPER